MGAGASARLDDTERLPDKIDQSTAQNLLGKCFDFADWETMAGDEGVCTHLFHA